MDLISLISLLVLFDGIAFCYMVLNAHKKKRKFRAFSKTVERISRGMHRPLRHNISVSISRLGENMVREKNARIAFLGSSLMNFFSMTLLTLDVELIYTDSFWKKLRQAVNELDQFFQTDSVEYQACSLNSFLSAIYDYPRTETDHDTSRTLKRDILECAHFLLDKTKVYQSKLELEIFHKWSFLKLHRSDPLLRLVYLYLHRATLQMPITYSLAKTPLFMVKCGELSKGVSKCVQFASRGDRIRVFDCLSELHRCLFAEVEQIAADITVVLPLKRKHVPETILVQRKNTILDDFLVR